MRIQAICHICGAEYWKTNGKSKYCSVECKREGRARTLANWRTAHPTYMTDWLAAHPNYMADRAVTHGKLETC